MEYRPDHLGTRRDVLESRGVRDEVTDRADRAQRVAIARAPVHTGYYRSQITVSARNRAGDRFGAVVFADAPYSWARPREVEARHHVFRGLIDFIERGA